MDIETEELVEAGLKKQGWFCPENNEEVVEAHWDYIESLLVNHGEDTKIIAMVKFHYISAFIHGWKHGVEEVIEND